MNRALELARKGWPTCAPNPMVGSVIVHNGLIIGEGYHKEYGGPHAEAAALDSVKNKALLRNAILYVSLEPCNHYGKTPPCSTRILEAGIPKVVIGSRDPYKTKEAKGIEFLKAKGVEVIHDVLRNKCENLNKRFFTFHRKERPYIILKWAQSQDGFMAPESSTEYWITNALSNQWNHCWRSSEMSILIGKHTAEIDNPLLTTRHVYGANPTRLLIDPELSVDRSHFIFSNEANTVVFNAHYNSNDNNVHYVKLDFDNNVPEQILDFLYLMDMQSIIVEGGLQTLTSFIETGLWDEARIFTGSKKFNTGLRAPDISHSPAYIQKLGNDLLSVVYHSL